MPKNVDSAVILAFFNGLASPSFVAEALVDCGAFVLVRSTERYRKSGGVQNPSWVVIPG